MFCFQDSDELWLANPPVKKALKHMLATSNVTLAIGWEIRRNAPVPGQHSGPDCAAVEQISLSKDTTDQLKKLVEVSPTWNFSSFFLLAFSISELDVSRHYRSVIAAYQALIQPNMRFARNRFDPISLHDHPLLDNSSLSAWSRWLSSIINLVNWTTSIEFGDVLVYGMPM